MGDTFLNYASYNKFMEHFICFLKVNTGEKMWIYMLGKFIHDSYADEWYNGQWERTPEYIGNKVSMLIGMPRLRQLRIKEGKLPVCIFGG